MATLKKEYPWTLNKFPLVEVRWIDAFKTEFEGDVTEAPTKPIILMDVGYFIAEDEYYIHMAREIQISEGAGEMRWSMSIPKVNIVGGVKYYGREEGKERKTSHNPIK